MATRNSFDLLRDDDDDDPSRLIADQEKKLAAKKAGTSTAPAAKSQSAKLPTKPLPPSQAMREARSAAPGRGYGSEARGGVVQGRGRTGRGRFLGQTRGYAGEDGGGYSGLYGLTGTRGDEGYLGKPADGGRSFISRGGRMPFRGGRRGGYTGSEAEGEEERPQRRVFERHSGTGRGNELKRQGSGRGNWGTHADDVMTDKENSEATNTIDHKDAGFQKTPEQVVKAGKKGIEGEAEGTQREDEDKEMTLEEYEKIKEEKRKALLAMKSEERKVEVDREFESMKLLSIKKGNHDTFLKLGLDGEKAKDNTDKVEKVKKSVSINEFLKPAAGESSHTASGRGDGHGRGREGGGDRGFQGGRSSGSFSSTSSDAAIKFEDAGQFPTLGGK